MEAQRQRECSPTQFVHRLPHGTMGPACKLAWRWLWDLAGNRPDYLTITADDLAAEFARDRRSATDWLLSLIDGQFLDLVDRLQGRWRVYVFDPREQVRRARPPDPQLTFAEFSDGSEEAHPAQSPIETDRAATVAMPQLFRAANGDGGPSGRAVSPAGEMVSGEIAQYPPRAIDGEERELHREIERRKQLEQQRLARFDVPRLGEQNERGGNRAIIPAQSKTKSESFHKEITKSLSLSLSGGNRAETPAASIEQQTCRRVEELMQNLIAQFPGLYPQTARAIVEPVLLGGWMGWDEVQAVIDRANRKHAGDEIARRSYLIKGVQGQYQYHQQRWPGKRNNRGDA